MRKTYVLILLAGFVCCGCSSVALAGEAKAGITLPAVTKKVAEQRLTMAQEDPEGFFKLALKNYNSKIRDYTCTFIKQEFVKAGLTKEQKIRVKFREGPFSVFMKWVENPGLVDRVLYVEGRNNNQAMVKPAGFLGVFVRSHVSRPINGPDAAKLSRKRIDQFGFENALKMIIDINTLARKKGDLKLTFAGTGSVDSRPTLVFERYLPRNPCYPDQHLVVHVDRDWLVPVATFCYDGRDRLLGKYIFADVKLNPGLAFKEFTAKANGL